jgi:hypothetical protein
VGHRPGQTSGRVTAGVLLSSRICVLARRGTPTWGEELGSATRCRYGCGEPPHYPPTSCLSAEQRIGLVVGQVLLWIFGLGLLIGTIIWAAATYG